MVATHARGRHAGGVTGEEWVSGAGAPRGLANGYYNGYRIHQRLNQKTPEEAARKNSPPTRGPKRFCLAVKLPGVGSHTNGRMVGNSPYTGLRCQNPFRPSLLVLE